MLVNFGRQSTTLEIADDQRVSLHRGPAALADAGAAVAAALDAPFHFPPLRQAVHRHRVALGRPREARRGPRREALERPRQVVPVVGRHPRALDPRARQSGRLEVSLEDFGWERWRQYHLRDLMDGSSLAWDGNGLQVDLDPAVLPARILRLE